ARVESDHVVTVYDVGVVDGQCFYSMRYVKGRSLKEVLRDGPVPGRRAAIYMASMAKAVASVHTAGIIHRDIKPRNILVDSLYGPYWTDFGLGKGGDGRDDLTREGMWLGTPNYRPPEQAIDPGRVSAASDIYSLGAPFYELLTGRPPFQAPD